MKLAYFLFLAALTHCDAAPYAKDQWSGPSTPGLDLSLLGSVKSGVTTESELATLFGSSPRMILTFIPPLSKQFGSTPVPIDRIVMYDSTRGEKGMRKHPDGMLERFYQTKEFRKLTFFTQKGIVRSFSLYLVGYEYRPDGSRAPVVLDGSTDDVKKYAQSHSLGEMWPNSACDLDYYKIKVQGMDPSQVPGERGKCSWEKP